VLPQSMHGLIGETIIGIVLVLFQFVS
jgi:hypothetical protein